MCRPWNLGLLLFCRQTDPKSFSRLPARQKNKLPFALRNVISEELLFKLTKAEDYSLDAYYLTIRDSITKSKSLKKFLDEYVQVAIDHRLTTIQGTADVFLRIFWNLLFWTVCFQDIPMKMSAVVFCRQNSYHFRETKLWKWY